MQFVINLTKHFHSDSLYRNSIYLMASTFVMAFFGFFFWVIYSKLFTPEQIGISTSLLSVVSLISSLSLFGFNNSLIRYLPTEKNKADDINTVFTTIIITSIIIGIIFTFYLSNFSPILTTFSQTTNGFLIVLNLFVIITSINGITDSVFIAMKSAKFILIINSIMSAVKLSLPFLLFSLGTNALIYSFVLSVLLAMIMSLVVIQVKFKIPLRLIININSLKKMGHFSIGNHLSNLIGSLPTMLLPIFILNTLGANIAAFYYMPMMIANLLYIIPSATTKSLFAEGSYDELNINKLIKKSILLISLIMIPCILAIFILGKYVLLAFGKNYSSEGITLLYFLAISGLFVSINSVIWTIYIIKKKVNLMIIISIINTVSIFLYIYLLLDLKLTGIGLGWLLGQVTVTIVNLIVIIFFLKPKS